MMLGRIGLRCKFCRNGVHFPNHLTPDIYIHVVGFQRVHLPFCEFIPIEMKERCQFLKESGKRGRRQYWEESARVIGLMNNTKKKIVVYNDNIHNSDHNSNALLLEKLWSNQNPNDASSSSHASYVSSNMTIQMKGSVDGANRRLKEGLSNTNRNRDTHRSIRNTLMEEDEDDATTKTSKSSLSNYYYDYDSDQYSVDPEECVDIRDYFRLS